MQKETKHGTYTTIRIPCSGFRTLQTQNGSFWEPFLAIFLGRYRSSTQNEGPGKPAHQKKRPGRNRTFQTCYLRGTTFLPQRLDSLWKTGGRVMGRTSAQVGNILFKGEFINRGRSRFASFASLSSLLMGELPGHAYLGLRCRARRTWHSQFSGRAWGAGQFRPWTCIHRRRGGGDARARRRGRRRVLGERWR